MNYKRNDVILCKVPIPSKLYSQYKLRPGVIVSNNLNNNRLDDLIIAICTSNISRYKEKTQLLIVEEDIVKTGIKVPSVIKCESLFTINKSMIVKLLGSLSNNMVKELNQCLKASLEL
jgi:mRNA interferase MazF